MDPIKRFAVRGLLITPSQELLLMKLRSPDTGDAFWVTPGGGIEIGENEKDALLRELLEELGLEEASVGSCVWKREHAFVWEGKRIVQNELFYLVQVERFVPSSNNMPPGSEARAFQELRWWSLDSIASSNEVFAPRDLAKLVKMLLLNGPPKAPREVGV